MTTKDKGRNGGSHATHKHYKDGDHYTKPSRISRRQKRSWKGMRK